MLHFFYYKSYGLNFNWPGVVETGWNTLYTYFSIFKTHLALRNG